jgi:guanylate kinase
LKNKGITMAEKPGKIFIVSGPSGAGKSTIVAQALERLAKEMPIERVVTYTSRPARPDEKQGVDYMFVTGTEFSKKEKEGFFLETVEFVHHRYGSPVSNSNDIELGNSFIYVVEIAGAKQIKKTYRDAVMIWIEAPDMVALKSRLKKRGVSSEADFENRMAQAKTDMAEAHKGRLFDYILVNDEFQNSVEEFISLVRDACSR